MPLFSTTAPRALRNKSFVPWLPSYFGQLIERRLATRLAPGTQHVLVALCDHFEPDWRTRSVCTADARAARWRADLPTLARHYQDASGRHPRHTFFVPVESIRARHLRELGHLAAAGFGEVELHLHHDGDDERSVRAKLAAGRELLAHHGHLARSSDGSPRFAFIHGNWALANARPDRRHCGVDDELRALFAEGCYADFTFPAFPDPSQPRVVNRLYWPTFVEGGRRAADDGAPATVGVTRADRMLIVQGPLGFARREGTWLPRVDYGALTAHDPATAARLRTWLSVGVHVRGRPEWTFVKLHTHGAPEAQADSLLGRGGHALHRALRALSDSAGYALHYVTARELFNIAMAAMAGHAGNPDDYRDFTLPPPPIAAHGT